MAYSLTAHFEWQAAHAERLGSPFMVSLCRALPQAIDANTMTGQRLLEWPGDPMDDVVALRLCGALHSLVISRADPELAAVWPPNSVTPALLASVAATAIARHDSYVREFLTSAPQTNEVGRSAMLLPGFLEIARRAGLPLRVLELGASAGLNLCFDAYRYDYGGDCWGSPESPLVLRPTLKGRPPNLSGTLAVADRAGCDIAPIDIRDLRQYARLRAYVWPDQSERLHRLEAAATVARRAAMSIEQSHADAFVEHQLCSSVADHATVIFHSVTWQYLQPVERDTVAERIASAGGRATPNSPVAWLRMEPEGNSSTHATLSLTMWPGGATRPLAHCDFHGRWIEMLDESTS